MTVVSDSALNDYEAFRRGDRFYVKIPLADFSSALPQLRADGFEDVQVQRVGDNVVVSFKLQPGATARVEQRSNRLDVIFQRQTEVRATTPQTPERIARHQEATLRELPRTEDPTRRDPCQRALSSPIAKEW